jgi:ribonucleoside-diphosphate reductase alpha chain
MAAERGAFIDQSQSLNLFMESPTIGKLSSMYLHAWKAGLKTTYYLRSRPATRINQTTSAPSSPTATVTSAVPVASATPAGSSAVPAPAKVFSDAEAVACSLENPESCEACD